MPFLPPRGTPDDEIVLFLFISFAILIVLSLLLVVVSCQTWMLWKMAHAVVEQDARLIRRTKPVDLEYGEAKRRSTKYEEEALMSGGRGEDVGRKRGKWLGRWI
jgi:hypothetical protein